MNLPNALTALRVVLLPFILIPAYRSGSSGSLVAAAVFAIAAFTDFLDGFAARQMRVTSSMGVFLDLTADKILVLSVLIALVQFGAVPAWAVIAIMAREVTISGLRSYAAATGVVIPAGPWGKLKTLVTLVALIALLAGIERYGAWLLYAAVALTVYSGLDYIWHAVPVLSRRTS